ncbi:MAG: Ig-like domain-containing protein, partial [Candidatus Odinarchaeota archaeon]
LYDKTSILKVNLEDYKLNIFHTPYEIEFINQSSFLAVKITEYYYNSTIFLPAEINMLETYFYRYYDCAIGKYSGYANNPNIFFSFIYTPTILSDNGEKIYINLVECALDRSLEREKTLLTVKSPQKVHVNETISVEAKLLDCFLTPLIGRRVDLLINGYLYASNITDFNGSTIFPIIFSKAGSYEVTVTYNGDVEYSNCSAKQIILVERTYTKILLSFKKDVADEAFTVTLQLLDEHGQPLSNQSILILVNGVRIQELITDREGRIIYRISFGENLKKVSVEFKYEGNEIYDASSRIWELPLENNIMLDLAVPMGLTAIAGCAGLLIIFLKRSNGFNSF